VNGSAVIGKAIGNVPGATANDIPWLKLDVVNHRGGGTLADVSALCSDSTPMAGRCNVRATMLAILPAFLIPPLMSSCAGVDDKGFF
jgi:hypothetical protein